MGPGSVSRFMKPKAMYLVLCFLGAAIPYWAFVPWLFQPGAGPQQFVRELFSNRISTFFALDLIISAVVLIRFMQLEKRRVSIRNAWLPIVATLSVGVSLGFPLFLYLRELKLEEHGGARSAMMSQRD